ncbi:Beta-barrel assembly machine subunit BamE [Breoghania corrubedonensis]|uniref:Beta-barrel assembly machine subunit BamE n=1 Tax=Breoghania corrubedonensis TaxID=665038 RepID=A0A2T5VAC5_9HYPH|nr:outer membrane protein assembly factor BamE [Breoghania corrubedonensis]PTW60700.1 Beta-barrel assembly machine subunit BamE [Breoghania corrubedonensis]
MRLNVAGNGSKTARSGIAPALRNIALVAAVSLALGGCFTKTLNRGNVITPDAMQQVQVGASREEVQLVLGTPSTTSVVDGETYYYISQKEKQTAFLAPDVVEQRVVAVYFDKDGRVANIADYGLKDGKVFDFISRTTRTGGSDYGLISQIVRGATKPSLGL